MNLKERLQQIAKNKIANSQKSPTTVKVKKTRVAKKVEKTQTVNSDQKLTYFPEVPVGHFGYSRPAEARPPTEKVRELTKKLHEKVLNKQRAPTKRMRYISKELIQAKKQ